MITLTGSEDIFNRNKQKMCSQVLKQMYWDKEK